MASRHRTATRPATYHRTTTYISTSKSQQHKISFIMVSGRAHVTVTDATLLMCEAFQNCLVASQTLTILVLKRNVPISIFMAKFISVFIFRRTFKTRGQELKIHDVFILKHSQHEDSAQQDPQPSLPFFILLPVAHSLPTASQMRWSQFQTDVRLTQRTSLITTRDYPIPRFRRISGTDKK